MNVKKGENKTEDFDESTIEVELKSARLLLQTLLSTLKAYRLYETNHPILSKFLERLEKDFNQYFLEFDSLSLQVGEHRLFYRGKAVYESQDVKESLAFLFYRDGVRELRFHKGLDYEEIIDFLGIVRKADLINRLEDDLVTLLWERDFPHIAFSSVDEFLEGGASLIPANEEDLTKRLEFKGSWEEGALEKASEGEPEESGSVEAEGLREAINPAPGQSLVQACQLTREEMDLINREAQMEQEPEHLFNLSHSLIEILFHLGEDLDAYENMILYFERLLKFLLEQGKVDKAIMILRDLSETMESMVLRDKQIMAIRRILEAPSRPDSIQLLGKAMKGNEDGAADLLPQYFRFLNKKAVDPLCLLLGDLESAKWRRVVCDCLVELCRDEIQPLTKHLSASNSLLVSHIFYVLGRIGHPSTPKYLLHFVNHQDSKMREEVLKLIAHFGEKGREVIEKFLQDPLPEIRGKASLTLAKICKDRAAKSLINIVMSEEFYKRDYDEKAYFFKALGETGSKEIIPILKGIAKKRKWFNRSKWGEMRTCAANALRMIGEGRA